ncbi:hypothetical protein [Micromonospora sp. NPDC003776]
MAVSKVDPSPSKSNPIPAPSRPDPAPVSSKPDPGVIPASDSPIGFVQAPADRLVRSATFIQASDALTTQARGIAYVGDASMRDHVESLAATSSGTERALMQGEEFQDLGYLLLDQIRLRPAGAVVGDLQFTMGLAPKERVVLTQKAWTKRNVSLEEVLSQSEETSIEYSSAFSTEIGENTEHQQQEQLSQSLSASVSGGYGPVSASVGYAASASQAQTATAQTTASQAREQTRKTSDKAKKEHRITFSVQTETGIENLSQRTIENPNSCHSLMLNIYRVHQKFSVSQERWGIRACWAPCIQDPGNGVRPKPGQQAGMTEADRATLADVASWVPPDLPAPPGDEVLESGWSEVVHSGVFGYRADVKTDITVPAGKVLVSLDAERHPDTQWGSLGWPWDHTNPGPGSTGTQEIWWHVGLKDCNPFGCPEPRMQIRTKYTVGPSSDALAAYADTLRQRRDAEYQRRLQIIQERLKQESTPGSEGGAFDPLTELMRRVVADIDITTYDKCSEVVRWHDAFEWENAAYELYPTWWRGWAPDGEQSRKTDFLNASWARLYIPIRAGMEELAFELLYGPGGKDPGLQKLIGDLRTYRADAFGQPGAEKVIELASWDELMPTDGTYLEPVLGVNNACEDSLVALMEAERRLIEAQAQALNPGRPK